MRALLLLLVLCVVVVGLASCGSEEKGLDNHGEKGASVGMDSNCRLETPIVLGTEDLLSVEQIVLKRVELDKEIASEEVPSSIARQNKKLSLYPITIGKERVASGFLGGRIQLEGSGYSFGLANTYIGTTSLQGTRQTTNGITEYKTTSGATSQSTIWVLMEGKSLIGLQMRIPVMRLNDKSATKSLEFTGEHQTLCLKSAIKE